MTPVANRRDPRNQRSRRGRLLPLPRRPKRALGRVTGIGVHGADQPSHIPCRTVSRRSKPTARSASSTSSACPTTCHSTVRASRVKRSNRKPRPRSHAVRRKARSYRCSIIPTSISISLFVVLGAGVSPDERIGRRPRPSNGGAQATSRMPRRPSADTGGTRASTQMAEHTARGSSCWHRTGR